MYGIRKCQHGRDAQESARHLLPLILHKFRSAMALKMMVGLCLRLLRTLDSPVLTSMYHLVLDSLHCLRRWSAAAPLLT